MYLNMVKYPYDFSILQFLYMYYNGDYSINDTHRKLNHKFIKTNSMNLVVDLASIFFTRSSFCNYKPL